MVHMEVYLYDGNPYPTEVLTSIFWEEWNKHQLCLKLYFIAIFELNWLRFTVFN